MNEVPECVKRWRAWPANKRGYVLCAGNYDELSRGDRKQLEADGEACLEWLATTPAAVIVAASSGDAQRMRKEQFFLKPSTLVQQAYKRATIYDSATHVVLPRDAYEKLRARIRADALELRALLEGGDDER